MIPPPSTVYDDVALETCTQYMSFKRQDKNVSVRHCHTGRVLFVEQPIHTNDIIIEYQGERISKGMASDREEILLKNDSASNCMLMLDKYNTVVDATFTENCLPRFINYSCIPSARFFDVNLHGPNGTSTDIHVAFVKAMYPIPAGGPIYVHYDWVFLH